MMRHRFSLGGASAFTTRAIARSIVLYAALSASPAVAIVPDLSLAQLSHSVWRLQDGVLPGIPKAIAQTTDGYLWIGTNAGLVRFDGAKFVPFVPPAEQGLKLSGIASLYGAKDGSLWMGATTHLVSRLMQWKDGQLRSYTPPGFFANIREAPDGSIWAARYHTMDDLGPLCVARNESLDCYGPKQGVPFKDAGPLAIEKSGAIWIATADRLARWQDNHSEVFAPAELVGSANLEGYKSVVLAADGSVWSGVIQRGPGLGLQHFQHGAWYPVVSGDVNSSDWEVTALLFDRDNTLWVGTANRGIYRIVGTQVDHFSMSDGLSADSINGFCEDHEGNVWVATSKGVDKFRPMRVNTISSRQGLTEDGVQAVLSSRDGAIWISNATAVERIDHSTIRSFSQKNGLPGRSPTAMFEDGQGKIWIGLDDGVVVFDHERFTRVHSGEQPIGPVMQFAAGPNSTVWANSVALPSRLVRVNETGVLETVSPPSGTRIGAVAAAPDGTLWAGLINAANSCDLARYSHKAWEIFPLRRPARTGMCSEIVTLDADTAFASVSDGIIEWRKGQVHTFTTANGLPCSRVNSLVFPNGGDLWLYLECGVAVIDAGQLAEWWNEPTRKFPIRLLDISDGALPGYADFHPRATVGGDGKAWFANGTDLQFIDPNRDLHNSVPPPVKIQTLIADERDYIGHAPITLPPLTRNVQIDFTALSFVAPQRVSFRYRLEGWDTDWQDPGSRRQSFYTNLHPGKYRFSVIAANDDGLWNEKGDSLEFTLAPAYYQTTWFRLLCVAGALLALQGVFIYRLRRAKKNMQQRLAARLIERERIARDLHDTLLQSVQGLILKFHAVANAIPPETAARSRLDNALAQGRDLIEEGRARVLDLRRADAPSGELAAQLTAYGASHSPAAAAFNVSVVGQPKPLNPVAANEALDIGREAIGNAFIHAEAEHIEVELTFGDKCLALRIRDDGKGIDEDTLQAGRTGHFGIAGMRERARSLGAKLDIWSRLRSGTEVELIVPSAIAYAANAGAPRPSVLERVRRRLWF